MYVLAKKPFDDVCKKYPNDARAIIALYNLLSENDFSHPEELRTYIPNLDNFKHRDKWWVINIGGNNLRVVAHIDFESKILHVIKICSHAEYDKFCKKFA